MNINRLRNQNMTFVSDNLTIFYIDDLCNSLLYILVHNKIVRNVYKYFLW